MRTHRQIVYVGKAKDLKQRLNHYRVANPDRMPRRHLKMVNAVARIEFQFCASESAALKHEKKLIRSLKPKFNRAGVWPGKPRFIVWRVEGEHVEMTVMETPAAGWQRFGPLGRGVPFTANHRTAAVAGGEPGTPVDATSGRLDVWKFMQTVSLECGGPATDTVAALEKFFWKDADEFILWLGSRFTHRTIPFERRVIETELGSLKEYGAKKKRDGKMPGTTGVALISRYGLKVPTDSWAVTLSSIASIVSSALPSSRLLT